MVRTSLALILALLAAPALAQVNGSTPGPGPLPSTCSSAGTSAAPCFQGVTTVTTIAGKNALSSITPGATGQIGTGGTIACAASHVCDSFSGELTLTTGTGTLTAGVLFTLNFADTRANLPNCTVAIGSVLASSTAVAPSYTNSSATFTSKGALTASSNYVVDYSCGGN